MKKMYQKNYRHLLSLQVEQVAICPKAKCSSPASDLRPFAATLFFSPHFPISSFLVPHFLMRLCQAATVNKNVLLLTCLVK